MSSRRKRSRNLRGVAEDIDKFAEIIEPGSLAAVLVFENSWAAPFASSVRRSGGQLVANGRIPTQALLAAKAGANIISPFIGRLDDISEDGMSLIAEIMEIWSHYKFDCEVLVASTRHPRHIVDAARLGAHISTIPYDVFKKLPQHTLTDAGVKKFQDDWAKFSK